MAANCKYVRSSCMITFERLPHFIDLKEHRYTSTMPDATSILTQIHEENVCKQQTISVDTNKF